MKVILLILLILLIGLFVGYVIGTVTTIKTVARMASGFIDPYLVEVAVWQYENNVGGCFPSNIPNASINRNSGE